MIFFTNTMFKIKVVKIELCLQAAKCEMLCYFYITSFTSMWNFSMPYYRYLLYSLHLPTSWKRKSQGPKPQHLKYSWYQTSRGGMILWSCHCEWSWYVGMHFNNGQFISIIDWFSAAYHTDIVKPSLIFDPVFVFKWCSEAVCMLFSGVLMNNKF